MASGAAKKSRRTSPGDKRAAGGAAPPSQPRTDAREQAVRAPFGSLEDWRIYVVIGVSALVIGGIVIANMISSLKGSATVTCVQTMGVMMKAIEEMDREVGFDFDVTAGSSASSGSDGAAALRALLYYYRYGEAAFEHDEDGRLIHPLRPLPSGRIAALTPVQRDSFLLDRLPPCPRGGVYRLEPSERAGERLPAVRCSVHGRLDRPDPQGHYVFDGRLQDLEPSKTAMGPMATLYLPARVKSPVTEIVITSPARPSAPAPAPDQAAGSPQTGE
ncbi:MAG: hypothetical protein Kow0059_06380 [Candidatus Sumerlaeia bacterium]